MKLITVITEPKEYFPILQSQANKLGYDLILLGLNEKWKGFSWRFYKIKKFLETITDDNEILIIVDGYDVIPLQGPNIVRQRFISFNCNILVSRDVTLNNFISLYMRGRIFTKCRNQGINVGLYMGYKSAIIKMYDYLEHKFDIMNNPNLDDQRIITTYCDNHKHSDIAIDINDNIFLTVANNGNNINNILKDDNPDIIINNDHVTSRKSQIEPCFVHGPMSTNLSRILDAYKLHDPPPLPRSNSRSFGKMIYYLRFFIAEITIAIIIIISIILIRIYITRKN